MALSWLEIKKFFFNSFQLETVSSRVNQSSGDINEMDSQIEVIKVSINIYSIYVIGEGKSRTGRRGEKEVQNGKERGRT